MFKTLIAVTLTLGSFLAGAGMFPTAHDSSCCVPGADCCYPGSPCCVSETSCCSPEASCCFPGSPCCESSCCASDEKTTR